MIKEATAEQAQTSREVQANLDVKSEQLGLMAQVEASDSDSNMTIALKKVKVSKSHQSAR